MHFVLAGLLACGLATAGPALPYDLKRAQHEGCVKETQDRLSKSEASLCFEATRKIAHALRFSYGVSERSEEDGCDLGDLRMQVNRQAGVRLARGSRGTLRAQLACFPVSRDAYIIYVDFDALEGKVTAVIHAEL